MPKERLILKAQLLFVAKASGGGVRFQDKKWIRGIVYLTDQNLWFKVADKHFRIPIDKVEAVGREADIRSEKNKILLVDYDDGSPVASTAILAGPAHVVNTFKHQIAFLMGHEPKIEKKASDIDNKLIMLLSLGVKDWDRLKFLLGVDDDMLKEAITNLKDWGLIEESGKLSIEGIKYAGKMGG